MQTDRTGRILYIPHGGGPLPLLGDAAHRGLVDFLTSLRKPLGTPSAIIVVSAHWEETVPTITSGATPPLIYDYYGFPAESYRITYPAPGDPNLAHDVHQTLKSAGIESRLDPGRGFDHGLFVPLKIMVPDASIPCVQLSLVRGLDPATHIQIGRTLSPLMSRNILVVGSGFSFHNMQAFFSSQEGERDGANEEFQQWLVDLCTDTSIAREDRERRLTGWESAPSARYCHPREEHLLPLHVCSGLAGTAAKVIFDGEVLGKRAVAFLWQ
jgi:4,5-DOPA dioxygenase extradiol